MFRLENFSNTICSSEGTYNSNRALFFCQCTVIAGFFFLFLVKTLLTMREHGGQHREVSDQGH